MGKPSVVYKVTLEVPYYLPVSTGHDMFGYFNPNMKDAHFPSGLEHKCSVDLEILHIGTGMRSKAVLDVAQEMGLKRPLAHDLVALGLHHSERWDDLINQYRFVVCLCKPWKNLGEDLVIPILKPHSDGLHVDLDYFANNWFRFYLFPFVRERKKLVTE
jgi:hypothetical protein